MGGRLNMVVFVGILVLVASLQLHTSKAQTTHTVGDSYGWSIPPQANTTYYTAWASQQTFTVGDTLVFNFTAGAHDVAEVSQAALSSCSATNPISLSTITPTSIVLNTTGGHYFICTFASHCNLGQSLTINVSAASTPSPAPQPSTPPPPSSPTPTPSPVSPPPTPSPLSPPPTSPSSAPAPSPTATPPPGSAPAPSPTATPPSGSATPPSPGPTTSPPPTGSTTSPPPPPPNSATSVAVTALPLTLLAIALAFLN